MLNKETFVKAINSIIEYNKRINALNQVNEIAAELIVDYTLQDDMISLLEEAMNLPVDEEIGSTISWWIYDTQFGTDEPFIYFDKGTKKEEKLVLDTIEKLYDFCKQEGESNL